MVRLLNALLLQASMRGASDIHMRPGRDGVAVDLRIDGCLRRVRTLDPGLHPGLVSRIKIVGGMNIAERRLPQDGRARLSRRGRDIDLRISVLPTVWGESVALRLLYRDAGLKTLDDLGLNAAQCAALRALTRRAQGLLLVTGPTGAGKTTTLYALVDEIRRRGVHILSVEDPVEYEMEGVEQVQVAAV